jgi:hypothetical protein
VLGSVRVVLGALDRFEQGRAPAGDQRDDVARIRAERGRQLGRVENAHPTTRAGTDREPAVTRAQLGRDAIGHRGDARQQRRDPRREARFRLVHAAKEVERVVGHGEAPSAERSKRSTAISGGTSRAVGVA